jgi:hypothetical protein
VSGTAALVEIPVESFGEEFGNGRRSQGGKEAPVPDVVRNRQIIHGLHAYQDGYLAEGLQSSSASAIWNLHRFAAGMLRKSIPKDR